MNYDEIKEMILKTINSDDIVYDGETISAFDLIKVINQEFGKIKFMIENKDLYTMMFKLPQTKLYKHSLKNYIDKLSYIDFGHEKVFFIFNKEDKGEFACLSVSKDENGNLVDTNSGLDNDLFLNNFKNEFISLNYDLINKIINSMEELKEKYNLDVSYGENACLFPLNYFDSSYQNYTVFISDLDGYFNKNCILLKNGDVYFKGLEENILTDTNLLDDNNSLLLKKIPIMINKLHPLYQKALKLCYNEKDKVLKK